MATAMARLAFFGTPELAATCASAVVVASAGGRHQVVLGVCQTDKPVGRGHKLEAPPTKKVLSELGVPMLQPATLKKGTDDGDAFFEAFKAARVDLAIVVAYGRIIPQRLLELPVRGFVNVHASLLPRWRGAAPIQRAILAGDEETGVAIMRMEAGLDTGPALLVEKLPITASMNAGDLHDALAALGARLIVRALENLDRLVPEPQSEQGVTYAAKIGKEEGRLDWSLPAPLLARRVRAFAPLPGAWFDHQGERFKVLKAEAETGQGTPGTILDDALRVACGEGVLRLLILQRAGKGALDAQAFLRGYALPKGTVLA
jgi:methionyl-tRNA formyltransferase